MNNYSEFQVNIFSNNSDIRLHSENSKSKKGITLSIKIGRLPPLLVWVPLLIVNNYSEFQVNIFSNNRDIRKYQSFACWQQGYDNTLMFFLENSRAKKKLINALGGQIFKHFRLPYLFGYKTGFSPFQNDYSTIH